MQYRPMTEADLPQVIDIYVDYYNRYEGGQWTAATTKKRILQVLTRQDAFCLVLEDGGAIIAFALGYFEQYDDGFAYDLVEIVVAADHQGRGIGTRLMKELEGQVREKGALLIQFQAVNDDFHHHFYGKLGYQNATNLVIKTKLL